MSELKQKEVIVEAKEYYDMRHELCEYHMLEQELGVGITTLFKALKYGVFRLSETERPLFTKGTLELNCDYGNWDPLIATTDGYSLRLGDYGKTWALTPEELEK